MPSKTVSSDKTEKKGSQANSVDRPANSSAINTNVVFSYLKGVKQEFKNISWPGRQQIIAETVLVIIVVGIFAVFTSLIDLVYNTVIGLIT